MFRSWLFRFLLIAPVAIGHVYIFPGLVLEPGPHTVLVEPLDGRGARTLPGLVR